MSTDWCRGFGGAPWECRYFSISPFCWSETCTGQPSFYSPFGFYFSLGCFHWFFALHLFCFSDKAGVFVGSSVGTTPPVFPFFSPCLPCPFILFVCLFFSLLLLSSFAFITSSFLLSLFLISLSFSGFLVKEIFSPFLVLIFVLGAKVSKCISESFGWSGYIPCRIGKDGGFIRRDRSFYQPSESWPMRDRYP